MTGLDVTGDKLVGYVDHFRCRLLQDALNEATAVYWLRRAAAFEAALPRVGDYTGRADCDEVAARALRLAAIAAACRNRAAVSLLVDDIEHEVADAIFGAEAA